MLNIISKIIICVLIAIVIALGFYGWKEHRNSVKTQHTLDQANLDLSSQKDKVKALESKVSGLELSKKADDKAQSVNTSGIQVVESETKVKYENVKKAESISPDWSHTPIPDSVLKAISKD